MRFFYLQRGFTYLPNTVADSEAISEQLWFHLISTRAKDIPEGGLAVVVETWHLGPLEKGFQSKR